MPRHIGIVIADMGAGGAQRVVSQLSNAWASRGNRVTIFTYESAVCPSFFELLDAVRVIRMNCAGKSDGLWSAIVSNVARVKILQQHLNDNPVDVILAFLPDMVFTSICAVGDIPVIACERTDPRVYPVGIWRYLRNWAYKKSQKIICQTPYAAAYFNQPHKTVVIPNPVTSPDISGIADISLPSSHFISSLGRLSHEKGHDILIAAFARIADIFPDVNLLLIGDGPEKEHLKHHAEKLGLSSRVYFSGASKNPFPVLAQSAAFILPSRFEGFPNALAEAMALGIPCLAARHADGGLIVDGHNGRLVPGDDVAALAHALQDMLSVPDKSHDMGRHAAETIKALSLKTILEQWDKIILT